MKNIKNKVKKEFEKEFPNSMYSDLTIKGLTSSRCINEEVIAFIDQKIDEAIIEGLQLVSEKLLTDRDREWAEAMKMDRKSVDELLPIIGGAYNDLSVHVAYKEGLQILRH